MIYYFIVDENTSKCLFMIKSIRKYLYLLSNHESYKLIFLVFNIILIFFTFSLKRSTSCNENIYVCIFIFILSLKLL